MTLTQNKKAIIMILIAFIFSFAVRLIWVYQFQGAEQFKFNNEFMINTNDGYFFAEGARDILAGEHQENDLSPVDNATSKLTAFLAKILPISFETLIFYMPAFFASLIVIPIILIAREFEKLEVGFIAALIASIAWSYYNRTMVGYYDTDQLNIVFPTILLWSLIWAIKTKEEKYFLIAALDSIAYRWWYPQSYSLEFAFIGLVLFYGIYQFIKKEDFKSILILLSFLLIAVVDLDIWIRLVGVIFLYIILQIKKELVTKYIYYIFIAAGVLFFFTGGLAPILDRLQAYVFKDSVSAVQDGLSLSFFTVMQTVREAGSIPFETFANRISGHTITFILSVIGYIWFIIRFPIMFLGLPMVGLGFLAYGIPGVFEGAGLRFTVYAVPVMALGIGFFIYEISQILSKQLKNDNIAETSKYLLMIVLTTLVLYPNVAHVREYKVPTVFSKPEVEVLDKFKGIASKEDYMVSWWDYGYPIRYYSDVKTLVDGGKHTGNVNFPVSFTLLAPQELGAKMARLDVEYTEKQDKKASSNIEQMILDYGYENSNDFLVSLETDIKLPPKTRDIYLYLPHRMMGIFPTVMLFSNIDLMSGTKNRPPFFYTSQYIKNQGTTIELGSGVKILSDKGKIQVGNNTISINSFVVTSYTPNGLKRQVQVIDKNAPLNIIYMKDYKQFLVMDHQVFNSTYIQLFVLENYNPNIYQPIILSPMAKIFKLKI